MIVYLFIIFNPIFKKKDVITQRHGYPIETYEATTDDGYILTIFRLPNDTAAAQTVYIQHGANTDSTVWVDIGNRSLGKFSNF